MLKRPGQADEQPTETKEGLTRILQEEVAKEFAVVPQDICTVCWEPIKIMSFRGTGVCGEIHRKVRDGEAVREGAPTVVV